MLFTWSVEADDLSLGARRLIGHTTFQLRGGTLPLNYRRPSEIFIANV